MKITTLDRNVQEVLSLGYYNIPRFQRPFSWEKTQVEDFWSDTITDNTTDYFIGSMVVYEEDRAGKSFGIVDGQQRLTTITLTLCALRNAFEKQGFHDQAFGVHNLIERKNIDNKPEYVLQPETSYPYFQEHIQKFGNPDIKEKVGEEEKLLKAAFDLISGNIEDSISAINLDPSLNEDAKKEAITKKLTLIREKILGLKVIYITLDNEDDAYVIFETMNTRGKDLTIADLLKSHLLKPIKPKNAKVDIYKENWNEIVTTIEKSGAELDEFLYHHWLSKYERYVPAKKLFKSIKKEITPEKSKPYFDELYQDSKIYLSILNPGSIEWSKNELEIRASLDALALFRVKQHIPMLLSVMRDYRAGKLKQKHVQGILVAIENFHFVFSVITSQRSSGGISGMYASHAIKLVNTESFDEKIATINSLKGELKRRLPSYQQFEANFPDITYTDDADKQKKLVQYILAKIDSFYAGGLPIDYAKMTIEHLSPQNPKDKEPLQNAGQLGNLILVNADLNIELDNKSFLEKKAILAKSRVSSDDIIKHSENWDEEKIEERTRILSKLAYEKVWRL
jgi:uncharacterized protein with ParB-like and HNH nuclease domain